MSVKCKPGRLIITVTLLCMVSNLLLFYLQPALMYILEKHNLVREANIFVLCPKHAQMKMQQKKKKNTVEKKEG